MKFAQTQSDYIRKLETFHCYPQHRIPFLSCVSTHVSLPYPVTRACCLIKHLTVCT